ncbi:MAG: hypothetical protein ABIK95_04175 [Acidobacteriota bacterium]
MKKKRIIIVGGGEHSHLIINNLEDCPEYHLVGLTTHLDSEISNKIFGFSILCHDRDIPELIKSEKIDGYILGVGVTHGMKKRKKIFSVVDPLISPINIIHPTCVLSKHARIGKGNFFEAYTKIAIGAVIGNHCIINSFSAVNHGQIVGDNVLIACNVSLAGKKIGSHTIIADGASVAFKVSVGENCIVGDGAVVTKDLPDGVIAYGNPAKIVRSVES